VRLVQYLHHLIRRPQGLLDCVLHDLSVLWLVHQSLVCLQQPAVDAVEAVRLHSPVEVENTGLLEQPAQEEGMWHWFACAMEMGWGGWTGREDEHCRLVEPWDNCCWGSRQCTALRLLVSEARAGRESRSLCGNGGKEVLGERGWEGFGAPGRHAGRLCGTGFGGAERRVRLSQDKLLTGAAQSTQKRGFGDEGDDSFVIGLARRDRPFGSYRA